MRKPLIGITSVHNDRDNLNQLSLSYSLAVEEAGGIPLIIPSLKGEKNIKELVKYFDGLLLSGGLDPDPVIFGEEPLPEQGEIGPERDRLEIILVKEALSKGVPLLGICRGMQILNLAAGGSIYQDINTQRKKVLKHMQEAPRYYPTHQVSVMPESRLAGILKEISCRVNSFHHQAVNRVASGFAAAAYAPDGVIEAMESLGETFVLGVQWHPETMRTRDKKMSKIFKHFISASRRQGGSSRQGDVSPVPVP